MLRRFIQSLFVLSLLCGSHSQAQVDFDLIFEQIAESPLGFKSLMDAYGISESAQTLDVIKRKSFIHPASGYLIESLELKGEKVKPFSLHIRYPGTKVPDQSMPVIFVAAGLYSSADTLNLLPRRSDVVFVVFEYSFKKTPGVDFFAGIESAIPSIPQQVSSALNYLSQQPWSKPNELHSIGISFGSLVMPLCLRVAQLQGTKIHSAILAYGGADISIILDHELEGKIGHREREILVEYLSIPLKFFDPTRHLPELSTEILIAYGKEDRVIPFASTEKMIELTPEPKTVVELPGAHIDVGEWEVISNFGNLVVEWFLGLGTIEE